MRKWMILMIALFALGCSQSDLNDEDDGRTIHSVDANDEVAPHFEKIETLLTQIELEVGLDNLTEASSFFDELMVIVHGHEVTEYQQARINTMSELLADMQAANAHDEQIFTGSDAAAKVMNLIGVAPSGYTFVYHETPSAVGSDGMGYYVFLVPIDHADTDEMAIKETFFVTESGEILNIE